MSSAVSATLEHSSTANGQAADGASDNLSGEEMARADTVQESRLAADLLRPGVEKLSHYVPGKPI